MKSPLITLLLVLNLLAINLVSANQLYTEELVESDLVKSLVHEASTDIGSIGCIDETSCDHFCYVTSHMLAVFSALCLQQVQATHYYFLSQNEQARSILPDQPYEPPQ